MELTVQQPCPTCGAQIELKEDDRLLLCDYCDVNNFRIQQKLPRFLLPARLPSDVHENSLFYLPYLRFKGTVFYCQANKVHHKIVDTTRVGVAINRLPVSLGLRPQAMAVKPLISGQEGRFARQTIKARTVFSDAARITQLFSSDKKNPVLHRAFIGETISRIYLPAYVRRSTLYDGITHERIGPSSLIDGFASTSMVAKTEWEPSFLSTICPGCGSDMTGSRDSIVMTCKNCQSLWQEEGGAFKKLNFQVIQGGNKEGVHLPFWSLEVQSADASLNTLGDLIRLTNQPLVVGRKHDTKKLAFILPAFKINPNSYLNSAKNLTVSQLAFEGLGNRAVVDGYPVTLPRKEAVQSLKVILAGSAVSPKKVFGVLEKLSFRVTAQELLFLPFHWIGHDVRQDQTGYSFSSASLRFGRSL